MKKGEVSYSFKNAVILPCDHIQHLCHKCQFTFKCAGKSNSQGDGACVCNHDISYVDEENGLCLIHFCSIECFDIYCNSE